MDDLAEGLDHPVFRLAGFELQVLGREFPNSQDFWDGNWVVVNCCCEAHGARVEARGPFVHLSSLQLLEKSMSAIRSGASLSERADFIEPNLSLNFDANALGGLQFEVHLTPDNIQQTHRMGFDIEVSHLDESIRLLQAVMRAMPLREGDQPQTT